METRAKHHVLVVEDEPVTQALLVAYLEQAGFRASPARDGGAMREALAKDHVDLVLLDVELPGESGLDLVPAIQAASSAGIVFLTRRGEVGDRVVGLEVGGDDYIVKPPDMRELVARVNAVLRRRSAPSLAGAAPEVPRFGGWSLDPARRCLVSPRGEAVPLTQGEMVVLSALLDARGRIVPRGQLVEALRGAGGTEGSLRSLDVLVHRLRRKLGEGGVIVPRILLTVHNVGYRIAAEPG